VIDANCPNCGAAVHFRSADLPVKICDYCRSSLVRNGDVLQAMGKIAEVPEDVSPLQLGVRGTDGGVGFELIGRVRWRWTDGGWNEWLALFDDGSTAWIGEAMGRYMLLRQVEQTESLPAVAKELRDDIDVPLGTETSIAWVNYIVTDVKEATCAGGDGELPFSTPAGLTVKSVDLMAPDGQCASIQKERGEILIYAGRYVTLGDLKATGLRAFEGWPMPRFAA
jgi:hypothetical protein